MLVVVHTPSYGGIGYLHFMLTVATGVASYLEWNQTSTYRQQVWVLAVEEVMLDGGMVASRDDSEWLRWIGYVRRGSVAGGGGAGWRRRWRHWMAVMQWLLASDGGIR